MNIFRALIALLIVLPLKNSAVESVVSIDATDVSYLLKNSFVAYKNSIQDPFAVKISSEIIVIQPDQQINITFQKQPATLNDLSSTITIMIFQITRDNLIKKKAFMSFNVSDVLQPLIAEQTLSLQLQIQQQNITLSDLEDAYAQSTIIFELQKIKGKYELLAQFNTSDYLNQRFFRRIYAVEEKKRKQIMRRAKKSATKRVRESAADIKENWMELQKTLFTEEEQQPIHESPLQRPITLPENMAAEL